VAQVGAFDIHWFTAIPVLEKGWVLHLRLHQYRGYNCLNNNGYGQFCLLERQEHNE
jgi:hypothetical protein